MGRRLRPGLALACFLFVAITALVFRWGHREDYYCRGCNVILISIDTLRADRLGAYGDEDAHTPNIDRLASEALLFNNMYSQAPTTTPSHMSMMTSRYPSEHRVCASGGSTPRPDSTCEPALDQNIPTLAEMLQAARYYATASTGGRQVHGSLGFGRGFDTYLNSEGLEEFVASPAALDSLQEEAGDRPFFLFLHTYKTHDPYWPSVTSARELCGTYDGPIVDSFATLLKRTVESLRQEPDSPFSQAFFEELPHVVNSDSSVGQRLLALLEQGYSVEHTLLLASAIEEIILANALEEGLDVLDGDGTVIFRYPAGAWDVSFNQYLTFYQKNLSKTDLDYLSCLYDAEIHEMDRSVGLLLDWLDLKGLADDTVIVFTSDHGEEFYEHGGFLHEYLYEEILRVPLIIRVPSSASTPLRSSLPARTIDILPTVLDILGLTPPAGIRGVSLLPVSAKGAVSRRPLFAESLEIQYAITDEVDGRTYKLIEDHRQQLFDLYDDPAEQKDLAANSPESRPSSPAGSPTISLKAPPGGTLSRG